MPPLAQEAARPLRVAECRRCGQLFAVAAAQGEIACPACDATSAVSALEVVELQVAQPVVKPLESLVESTLSAAEASAIAKPQAPVMAQPHAAGPPTVADWLLQKESAKPAAPALERSDSKRSLAESLGWRGESLAAATHGLPADPPAERNPLADFRFDFGATPLSETPAPPVPSDVTLDLSSGNATPEPPLFDPRYAAGKPQRRGWSSVLSTAAGLLMIVVPGAYMALTWQDDQPLDGSLVAQSSAAETRERRASLTADEPAPFDPPPAAEGPSRTEATAIVDPATKPASFSGGESAEPKFNLPPAAPREIAPPATDSVVTSVAAAGTLAAEDPFAASTPQEPAPLNLPEDPAAALPRQEAAPVAPARTTSVVGLRNAPLYGGAELAASLAPAEEAGAAFVAGSLADPAQVAAMGQHYARLCHLAQVLTLLDASPSDTALTTAELGGVDVFKRLFRAAHSRDDSQQVAAHWIAWTGRPHGGVFFCGMPEELSPAGDVVQYAFRVGENTIPVAMAKPLDTSRFVNSDASQMGVLGVVVENPREWIVGYEGEADRVVWVRKTIPLAEPDLP